AWSRRPSWRPAPWPCCPSTSAISLPATPPWPSASRPWPPPSPAGTPSGLAPVAGRPNGRGTVPWRSAPPSPPVASAPRRSLPSPEVSTMEIDGLDVRGLTVRYGGATAVDRVSLQAPPARLTGLIGPNGAGKTSTFNAIAGLVAPAEGTIHLHGEDVSRRGPAERAQRGLGRTFQRMELFASMTVAENVALGWEARRAGSSAFRHLCARPGDRTGLP